MRELGVRKTSVVELREIVPTAHAAALMQQIASGEILSNAIATVSSVMFSFSTYSSEGHPDVIIEKQGLKSRTDSGELEQWCRDAIAANPKSLADFKAGKESAINGFKGSVMKAAKGKADPKRVDETLRKLLAAM